MDVLYVGGLAIFAVLTFALIAGCDRLCAYQAGVESRRSGSARDGGSASLDGERRECEDDARGSLMTWMLWLSGAAHHRSSGYLVYALLRAEDIA